MRRGFLGMVGFGGLGAFLSGCSVLSAFNALTPRDGGVERIARDVRYGDGPRHSYDVYAPKQRSGPLPLIVFVYGGGWYEGRKADYGWAAYALAAMGYVVAVPDYRIRPDVYPAFVEDTAAAIRHAVGHAGDYSADASRLGLVGHSSGAYNIMQAVLDPQYLGDVPVKAFVGLAGPYDFYPFDVEASQTAFGQWPRPEETQPLHHARKLDTRFFLGHSFADTVVYPKNAVNLNTALAAQGTSVVLKTYAKLSHADLLATLSVPFRGKDTVYADVRAFLTEALIPTRRDAEP